MARHPYTSEDFKYWEKPKGKLCPNCWLYFSAKCDLAIYCSDRCRTKGYRERKKQKKIDEAAEQKRRIAALRKKIQLYMANKQQPPDQKINEEAMHSDDESSSSSYKD